MQYRRLSSQAAIWLCLASGLAQANGLLVPTDRTLPPLSITYQRVNVTIRDQATETRVEQEFRNATGRDLEAEYLFPLPPGAGVKDFAMWISGKRVPAEMVEAPKAKKIYEDIVRRLQDPGLLEYMDGNLWKVRVYPVPANGRQKIEITYTEVASSDAGLAEYTYPLRTTGTNSRGGKTAQTQEDFTLRVELHSTASLKSVYSPTHEVAVDRQGDHKATVGFEQARYILDRDFKMYWTTSNDAIGLSSLAYRESQGDDGFFLMLISPEAAKDITRVPRDLVFVVDTSGSMKGKKMDQTREALKYCLKSLDGKDRFNLISFATTTRPFEDTLQEVNETTIAKATKWVDGLQAAGGTAISDALQEGLKLRTDATRNFTLVFMTDGLPTIGITDPTMILEGVTAKNTEQTRMFVFGVGDDVNTHLLDQLASKSRATSVYVRPEENLEVKVSSFYEKIAHPVFTGLSLKVAGGEVKLHDLYPPKLPDLFAGSQLTVMGRYSGAGPLAVRLAGTLGDQAKEFTYELTLPAENVQADFLPGLWARRKVGYLLDQIRLNGATSELKDEVITLAKRYGIVTPYTSYLVLPDELPEAQELARNRMLEGSDVQRRGANAWFRDGFGGGGPATPAPGGPAAGGAPGGVAGLPGVDRFGLEQAGQAQSAPAPALAAKPTDALKSLQDEKRMERESATTRSLETNAEAPKADAAATSGLRDQSGAAAVNVAEALSELKKAESSVPQASRRIGPASFRYVRGTWIDERVTETTVLVEVKYLSDAYFALLGAIPDAAKVMALGERIIWVTPSGKAVVIGPTGAEAMTADEVKANFQAKQ